MRSILKGRACLRDGYKRRCEHRKVRILETVELLTCVSFLGEALVHARHLCQLQLVVERDLLYFCTFVLLYAGLLRLVPIVYMSPVLSHLTGATDEWETGTQPF